MMKQITTLVCALVMMPLSAGIHFHGRPSALEVDGGSITFSNTATQLSDGTLRTMGSGSISNDASEYLTCSNMKIEHKAGTATKAMTVDGQLYLNDDTLTLDDNERLYVDGGQVGPTITVNSAVGTPALIQGSGSFVSDITVNSYAGYSVGLDVRWQGELNKNIILDTDENAAAVTLEDDLTFAQGKGVSVTYGASARGRINFNGHTLTVGGPPDAPFNFGGVVQTWSRAKLNLCGDISIDNIIYETGSTGSADRVSINGNGHKMHVVSGGIDGATSSYNEVNNIHLIDYGSGMFGGGGYWKVNDTISENSVNRQKVKINNAYIQGTNSKFFGSEVATLGALTDLELLTDIDLAGIWRMNSGLNVNGHGNTINFSDTHRIWLQSAGFFTDTVFKGVTGSSFYVLSYLYLKNIEWHDRDGNGALLIRGGGFDGYARLSLESGTLTDAGYLFDNDCLWQYGPHLRLLSDAKLSATWRIYTSPNPHIEGSGHVFNLENGTIDFEEDLHLSNITLAGMTATSLDREAGHYLYMNNVTWTDSAGQSVHINGTTDSAGIVGAAQVTMDATNTGDLFSSPVTWNNGVHLELRSEVTLSDAWTFSENSTIEGNGYVLDISNVAGGLTITEGKTLTLRNVMLKGWGDGGELVFGNNNATLSLAHVTILMSGDITLGITELLDLQGGVTIITGAGIFDATAAGANHTGDGGTVLFDIGSAIGRDTKVLFDPAANINVNMIPKTVNDFSIGDDGVTAPSLHIEDSIFLEYDIDANTDSLLESVGRQVVIGNVNPVTIRGNGRTLYFGTTPQSSLSTETSNKLLTATGHASNNIELHDLVLDGWSNTHIDDTNNVLHYCQGSIIRLRDNQVLTKAINIGTDSAGETIMLDLNGNDLDMSDDNAALSIADINLTLIVRNGRIINVKDGSSNEIKITPAGSTSTVVFHDVELVLSGDTTFKQHNITFKGNCRITGTADYELKCEGTQLTIDSGARLHIDDGITFGWYDDTATDVTLSFGSRNATLFLQSATLDASSLGAAPTLTTGTLRIDGMSTLIGDMTLGSATANLTLDIDIMPEAHLLINNGSITYANAT